MHPVAAWLPGWRGRVERLARRGGYAVVGGSDAHAARSIGRARTGFRGETTTELVAAIRARETWTEGERSSTRDLFGRHSSARSRPRAVQDRQDGGPRAGSV
jgi:hypothetical protein